MRTSRQELNKMTDPLNIDASERTVKGNNPLSLNQPDTVWLVSSGAMAVFAVLTESGVSQGERRYLFDVNAGDALFGVSTSWEGLSHQLIAIAYEETLAIAVPLEGWIEQANTSNGSRPPPIPHLMQEWCDRLVAVVREADVSLDKIETYQPDTPESVVACLHQFHADFLLCLHQLDREEEELRTQQFRDRLKLNQQVSERALGDLTAIFRRKDAEFLQQGTALLIAAGAVGRALGIEIRPPARSEDPKRIQNPLDAIARASRIRTRRVILTDRWWKSDCGPLLAYTAEGDRPVALLLKGTNRYEIFDPQQRRRIPVNANTAELISPIACMFYRPFPERVLKTLDILKFALRGQKRDIFVTIVLGIATSVLGMVAPQATGILIDRAIPDADRGTILQIALGLLAVSFGSTVFELVGSIASLRVQTLANVQIQAATWDRLLKLRVSFFRKYSTGDLQSRVSAIRKINQLLSASAIQTIFTSFFSLLNLGLLFVYSSQLALVALAIAAVNILVTILSGILYCQKMLPLEELEGEIFGLTVQLIDGVSKLHVAGAEKRAFAYWARVFSQQLKLKLGVEVIENAVNLFNTVLPTISSILIFSTAVSLIIQAQAEGGTGFSTGTFLAFNAAFGTFISGATSLSNTIIDVLEVSVLWERAKPIMEEMPEVDGDKSDPGRLAGDVKLDRVSFRYREESPLNLNQVTIEAKAGEFIALVGPSGSGKSTTIRLLLGFEQPEEGRIYYDGQDLSGLDISAVRRQLGVVLQNGRINSGSIFENISSGALVTMDEVWEAAILAGFAEDVEQMPMGMHTVISEGGSNLSGGQRQRLLIARALVLKPRILIFDEATSALDNRTQAIVSESLEQLKVTRIVIAHRLSTIRHADRIYVIAAGQVLQQGTFEELIAQPGMFADLMSRQIA